MLISQGSEFKLKFGGQLHEINANTFISSLIHNINILEEINRNIDSNKRIEIKVKAPEKGSVVVEIGIQASSIIEGIKTLFSDNTVSYSANLITVFGGIYATYKFLNGKKSESPVSKDGNNVSIVNSNGNVMTINQNVYNLYQNDPIIRESIAKNFESLRNDESIESFQILDSLEKPIVEVQQEDFEELSITEIENKELEQIEIVRANLRIIRLSFEGNLKSDFYYEGIKIPVKVKDRNFFIKIDEGEKFAKGDHLVVDLEIVRRYDQSVDTYVNKNYCVLKVYEHIPRGTQIKIT